MTSVTGNKSEALEEGLTVPAAQYLRVSTEQQQYSLQNQTDAIQQYAECHGFEVVRTYSDGGRSGLHLKGRSELIRLLHDVISGDLSFRAVLVYDVSRWGRFQDCDEAAHYEFLCKQAGVPVHYCAEGFANDNTLPASILKALKRTMAAEYSREMGARCFSGALRVAQLGFKLGGKAGYGLRRLMISAEGQHKRLLCVGEVKNLRTDRVILVPGPEEEVECVREMYRLVVHENRTPYFIAKELNRRGVRCPEGKWRNGLVCRILSDPKYAGYNVWNRTTQKLGQRRLAVPRAQWVLKQYAFEPIIDPQLYEHAQQVLAEQRCPYSNEELLDSLRELRKQKGSLSYSIVMDSPETPAVSTFIKRFGTLRNAFELAGHTYTWTPACRQHALEVTRMRQELVCRIALLFPQEVSIYHPEPDAQEYIQVDGSINILPLVCPSTRQNGEHTWIADAVCKERKTPTLLARLTADNRQFLDFHLMPRPGRHLIRHRGQLRHGKRLTDLSEFCEAVRAMAAVSTKGLGLNIAHTEEVC